MNHLKVFIASPGDVGAERQEIIQTLPILQGEFNARIDVVEWSEAPLNANESPETSIVTRLGSPRDCDLVVVVIWGRLGTFLSIEEYGQKPDGTPYTGTEWEYHEAIRASREANGRPRVVVFRRTEDRLMPERGPKRDEFLRQTDLVEQFFDGFRGESGEFRGYYQEYKTFEDFQTTIRGELSKQLRDLLAAPQIAKKVSSPLPVRQSYLKWLIDVNDRLEVRGLQRPQGGTLTVPLEKVYVALKVDATNYLERASARQVLLIEARETIEAEGYSADQMEEVIWSLLANSPLPNFIEARESLESLAGEQLRVFNAGEICQQDRRIVILGDPGSGKTTITRWLALVYAKALNAGATEVVVPRSQIDPLAKENAAKFVIGRPRFPVLVRVSEYAEDRQQRRAGKLPPRTLLEFLGHHTWFGSVPSWSSDVQGPQGPIPGELLHATIREELVSGNALVILDGLDEIPASAQRDEVIDAVDAFIREWVSGNPRAERGNQIVVTSRIAGYQVAPLRGDLTHVTVEPMTDPAVAVFVRAWMREVIAGMEPGIDPTTAADTRATTLLDLLAQPGRKHARELATNPLLASVIATVFYVRGGQLPRVRVELYQAAIDILIDIWFRRRHDQPGLDLLRHEVFEILPPLAAHIHEYKPTGYIEENELRDLALRELALARGENPLRPTPQLRTDLDSLIRVLRDDVGLLAAGARGVYRFLHLTFQEYLAARGLVRDLAQAPEQLRQHLGEPRWREPLLMALGYVNWMHPGAVTGLVEQLLREEGELADLFPQTALLVTTAVAQMAGVPDTVIAATSRRLLASYTALLEGGRLSESRALVERGFRDLIQNGHNATVEGTFLEALSGDGEHADRRAMGCAALIGQLDFVSPSVAESLSRVLPLDRAEWGYPITKALGKFVSPAAIADSKNPDSAIARLAWASPEWRFRALLIRQPELVQRVTADPDRLRLVVALYGGYWDLDAEHTLRRYRTIASYLQLDDNTRTPFTIFFREHWDRDDPVYGMAVYLDQQQKGFERCWGTLPTFRPAAIYRESPLTGELSRALRIGQPLDSFQEILRGKLSRGTVEERIDSLIALWAVTSVPLASLGAVPTEIDRVVRRIGSLQLSLRDSVIRASSQAIPVLRAAATSLPPDQWGLLFDALLETFLEAGSDPICTAALSRDLPVGLRSVVLAEEIVSRVNGWGDDSVYNAKVFADSCNAKTHTPTEIIKAIQLVGTTRNRTYGLYANSWSVEQIVFGFHDEFDIPPDVFDALEQVPTELSVIRGWAFRDVFPPVVKENPQLLPELLAMIAADLGKDRDRLDSLQMYDAEVAGAADVWAMIEERANALTNPYYRCRARLRLARHVAAARERLLDQASEDAKHVTDAPRAYELWERIAGEVGPDGRARALERARSWAEQLTDPADAVPAWLKLSRYYLSPECDEYFRRACAEVQRLPSGVDQARWLRIIAERAWDRAGIMSECERIATQLSGPVEREFALGRKGAILARFQRALITDPGTNQIWTPILLFARAADELTVASATQRQRAWAALAASPGPETVNRVIATYSGEEPITCSEPVARILDGVGRGGGAFLIPLFHRLARLEPGAVSLVRGWLTVPVLDQARIGALLLAEFEDLRPETTPLLLELLRSPDDLVRMRASYAINLGGVFGECLRTVSKLGVTTIEQLATEAAFCEPEEPSVAVQIRWHQQVLLLDSPGAIDRWCDKLERGEDVSATTNILSRLQWITDLAWEHLLTRFRLGDERIREAVLEGVARLVHRGSYGKPKPDKPNSREEWLKQFQMTPKRWAEFWHAVQDLDPTRLLARRILLADYEDILQFVGVALERLDGKLDPAEIARAGAALWDAHGMSFAALLGTPPDERRAVANLQAFGKRLYASGYNDCHEKAVQVVRTMVGKHAGDFPWSGFLALWAQNLLEASLRDEVGGYERCFVLELAAAAADLFRDTFRRSVNPDTLEPVLADAVRYHNTFSGRAAAMRLLGFLQRGTRATLEALKSALRDVFPVQMAAIDAAPRLQRVHDTILPELLEMLYDESALTAYSTAQLLVAVGQSQRTSAKVRRRIIEALARAARDPRSRRVVHFGHTDARIPDMPQLDDMFATALRKVCRFG